MADSGLDIGTLSGRIELTDNSDVTVETLTQRITALEGKFDSLNGRVNTAQAGVDGFKGKLKEVEGAASAFGDQITRVGERIVEYFAVREVLGFTGELLDAASKLDDLARQTGINVVELQVLGAATKEYGIDADQMGRAIFQVGQRIAGGDGSVVTALHMMGLSLEDVKGKQGTELFVTLERALGNLQGTMRDTAAADLFGARMGKAMEAFSTDVDGALDRAKAWSKFMDEDAVKAADHLHDELERLNGNVKAVATNMLTPLAEGANVLMDSSHNLGFWNTMWRNSVDVISSTATEMLGFNVDTHLLTNALDENNRKQEEQTKQLGASKAARKELNAEQQAALFMSKLEIDAVKDLEEWQKKDLDHLKDIGALTSKNAAAIGVNAAQFDLYKKSSEEAAKADAKLAEGWTNLNTLGGNYKDTIAGIDDKIKGSVIYYAQLGAKVQDLTNAFPTLTKTQAEAAVEAVKDAEKIAKANEQAALSIEKLYSSYFVKLADLIGTDTAKAQAAADKDYSIHAAEFEAKGVTDVTYYNSLWDLRNKDLELADQKRLEDDTHSKAHVELLIRQAQDYYDFQQRHLDQYTSADRDAQSKVLTNLKAVRDGWGTVGTAIDKDTKLVVGYSNAVMEANRVAGGQFEVTSTNFLQETSQFNLNYTNALKLAKLGYSFQEIVTLLQGMGNAMPATLPSPHGPKIPGFRDGGIGEFGEGTLAVLHGKEAIVPLNESNNVFGSTTLIFQVNGTGVQVAQQIKDVLVRELKMTKQFSALR